jgi:hypothetical protein
MALARDPMAATEEALVVPLAYKIQTISCTEPWNVHIQMSGGLILKKHGTVAIVMAICRTVSPEITENARPASRQTGLPWNKQTKNVN